MSRLIVALMWFAHFLPLPVQAAIGNALGTLLYWLIPERRRVTRVNLAKCFPAMSEEAREYLGRSAFRAFCRSFVERGLLWWAPRSRIERLIRVEGLEHVRDAMAGGKPVILFVPHFVGMDAGCTRLCCDLQMTGMYSQQKDRYFSAMLVKGRTRFGNQGDYAFSRQQGIRPLIRAMRAGRPLYYLPDQDYGPRDALFVPFFGVQAATVPGLSRIARMTGAKVLPCIPRMLPGGAGYLVTLEPAWSDFPGTDPLADTRRMNEYIERKVLEMPEQYLWMHKRFKTRPPGEARFYE